MNFNELEVEFDGRIVRRNQLWRHQNGDDYWVMAVGNVRISPERTSEYPPTVVYVSLKPKDVYCRQIKEFLAKRSLMADVYEADPTSLGAN